MSIENSLERIAVALESIAASKGNAVPVLAQEAPAKKKTTAPVTPILDEDPLGGAPVENSITMDDIHKALRGYMDKNKIEKTKELMIKYGANAAKPVLTSIPEKNYAALMKEIGG